MRRGVYVRVSTDDQRDLTNNYKNTAEEIVLNEYVFI